MKVSLVQADITCENKESNFRKYESLITGLKGHTDLVVMPEMFNTGFTMNSEKMAESMCGDTLQWMRRISSEYDFGLMGSYIVRDAGRYYNRLVFMKPDGNYVTYDKGHLFRMEKENMFYMKGNRHIIESFRGMNFFLQICYDLRFPVWSRNRNNAYDVLVYVANWPAVRRNVWNTLLQARAIENQAYVLGVNRVGNDENGIDYCGDTVIIDPTGEKLAEAQLNREEIITSEISSGKLKSFREKFPAWLDADLFSFDTD